jgi:hypothetical protein
VEEKEKHTKAYRKQEARRTYENCVGAALLLVGVPSIVWLVLYYLINN